MIDIAHLNLASGFRGGERQTQMLIESLAEFGYRQRLIARAGDELASRLRHVAGLEIYEVSGIIAAARAVKGAHLSHAHEGRCVQAAALARWRYSIPYVITRRVTRPLKHNPVTRAIYRNSVANVGLSSAIVAQLEAFTQGLPAKRIPSALTPTKADPATVAALRERWGVGPVVGNVGALVARHKGQPELIEVARRRPDWQIVLVGSGADESAFKAQATDLQNVHFAGQVQDVASHLASFDLFAFPSRFEGLGSILLDAMHHGLPIVASDVDGIPDIVQHEVTGLLVPPESPDSLEKAIDRLLTDDTLRSHCIARAHEQMREFTPQRMAERYAALYATFGIETPHRAATGDRSG